MDEFDLIERHLRPLAEGFSPALGLRDDAALLDVAGTVAASADALVDGVHLPPGLPPGDAASRALRAALSDLAAMGALPWCYLLVLALPDGTGEDWIAAFVGRLKQEQERLGIALAGGDTVRTPGPLTVSVTVLGRTGRRGVLRRAGARPGDALLVSGAVGDGLLGRLAVEGRLRLPDADARALRARFTAPEPRIALGRALAGVARAAIDVSDGFLADLRALAEASGAGAVVERDAVPLSAPARRALAGGLVRWADLASGGDDYELVLAVPADRLGEAREAARESGTPLARVGALTEEPGVRVLDPDGNPVEAGAGGYRHAWPGADQPRARRR